MNYTSFCEYLLAALRNQMEQNVAITKETIRKNNNVSLDALIIHMQDVASAPVVYLQPLYQTYQNGHSIDMIAKMILNRLKKEIPLSIELAEMARSLESAHDRIAYRLVSRKENLDLLSEIPWVPYLDLAVIFYLHLGMAEDRQITTIIHNRQADAWHLSPVQLYELAKKNTPRLCPSTIGRMDHILLGLSDDDEDWSPSQQEFPPLYILSNRSGINGAACMLYDDIIKDFADRIGCDLIILPSSIHEVLLVPDFHNREYEIFRQMVRSINAEDVPKEEVLSDEIYLYRRQSARIIKWNPCGCDNGNTGTCAPKSL